MNIHLYCVNFEVQFEETRKINIKIFNLWKIYSFIATMGDMEKAVCMADHFDKIQKLPDPIPGCPNFRRVPGFKVYTCGQPTLEGFEKCLEKVCGTIYPKDGPIIWFNLRQEPTVYVNGE